VAGGRVHHVVGAHHEHHVGLRQVAVDLVHLDERRITSIAMTPVRKAVSVPSPSNVFCSPTMTMDATTAMAEMALVSDISGLARVGATRRGIG
jgi:hypothetical protein